MTFAKKISCSLFILAFAGIKLAQAQLWRYINDSQEKEKAADIQLKKEAFSVTNKKTVAYGDTLTYDLMTYKIKSFDGDTVKINLWEKPFSDRVFHIDLPTDKLIIPDFYALARVHHISNDLLEIVYSPRGGSDDGYDNVLILGVDKNKFRIVMEIQSIHEFDNIGLYGLYNLHLKLQGTNVYNYKLSVNVRDLLSSVNKHKKSYDKTTGFLLKFDKDQHIFYTNNQKLDGFIYQDDVNAKKVHITGLYPMINLGQYRYCFVNNIWYALWKDRSTGEVTMLSYCQKP